jgi:actin-related protein
MYCGDEVGAFVGDIGSLNCKFGYAGEDTPKCIVPSITGVKSNRSDSRVIGQTALYGCQGIVSLPRAISMVDDKNSYNWDTIELLWVHAFSKMSLESSEHPILASISPFDMAVSEKYMELMFETFKAPCFYLAKDVVLDAFAFGKSTALVADVGAGSTRVVPVVDGFALQNSAQRSVVGGEALVSQLQHIIQEKHKVEITPCVRKYGNIDPPVPSIAMSDTYRVFRRLLILREFK